jgi:hypothetical protein
MWLVAVQLIAVSGATAPASLGPGRGAWVLEDPSVVGLTKEQLDLGAARVKVAAPIRCVLTQHHSWRGGPNVTLSLCVPIPFCSQRDCVHWSWLFCTLRHHVTS